MEYIDQIFKVMAEWLTFLLAASALICFLAKNKRLSCIALYLFVIELIMLKIDPLIFYSRYGYSFTYGMVNLANSVLIILYASHNTKSIDKTESFICFATALISCLYLWILFDMVAKTRLGYDVAPYFINSANILILYLLNKKSFKLLIAKGKNYARGLNILART